MSDAEYSVLATGGDQGTEKIIPRSSQVSLCSFALTPNPIGKVADWVGRISADTGRQAESEASNETALRHQLLPAALRKQDYRPDYVALFRHP